LTKRLPPLIALFAALALLSPNAFAYGPDVHFNLTYVAARLAGLPVSSALVIADADQSTDDNMSTSAFYSLPHWESHQKQCYQNAINWHAMAGENKVPGTDTVPLFDGGGSTIRFIDGGAAARQAQHTRLAALWAQVPKKLSGPGQQIQADIAVGRFLHAEQDSFSHRQFTAGYLDPQKYLPYGPRAGHVNDGDGHSADSLGLRPGLAMLMLHDTYAHLRAYAAIRTTRATAPVSNADLDKLVMAVAGTYRTKAPRPLNPLDPDTVIDEPLGQKTITAALSKALPAKITWRVSLPRYDVKFKLPYDNPKLIGQTIRHKVLIGLAHNTG
jgi:hypothetical protein